MKEKKVMRFFPLTFVLICVNTVTPATEQSRQTCFEEFSYCDDTEHIDRTVMYTRPVYWNLSAQLSLWHNEIAQSAPKIRKHHFQVVTLAQDSLRTPKTDEYFFFNGLRSLRIKGDNVPGVEGNQIGARNVRAEWLGLSSDYNGIIKIHPKQQQAGVWMEYIHDLCSFIDHKFFKTLWLGIAAPFQYVRNNIHLEEQIQNTGTGGLFQTATEAFLNPNMEYARIGGTHSKAAIAELRFKLGSLFLAKDGFQALTYTLLTLPTYPARRSEYAFEAVIGNDGHVGYGGGVYFQLPLNLDVQSKLITVFFAVENIYFFQNNQKRTVNLKGKPWSRYVLFNDRVAEQNNIPGPNVLTIPVHVRSYNMMDLTTGIRYEKGPFEIEAGYAVWARGREKISLRGFGYPDERYGISAGGSTFIPNSKVLPTASTSTIELLGPINVDDPASLNPNDLFVGITVDDLDFASGAARTTINHRIHMAGGFRYENRCKTTFIGLGGYLEIPQKNSSLGAWGFWFKVGYAA